MIVLLSPAKSLDYVTPLPSFTLEPGFPAATEPRYLDRSSYILKYVADYSWKRLGKLMDISEELAKLNVARYERWSAELHRTDAVALPEPADAVPRQRPGDLSTAARPAIFAFDGDVYLGFDVHSLTPTEVIRGNGTLRMLSGLYGLLRPLDRILPYRLEMGTRLKVGKTKDLYTYWRSFLTDQIEAEKPGMVVNLASEEYSGAVDFDTLAKRGIGSVHPAFEDLHKGEYKILGLFAKKARGAMARWIVRNEVSSPERLREFTETGYRYSAEVSTPLRPVFRRDQPPKPQNK